MNKILPLSFEIREDPWGKPAGQSILGELGLLKNSPLESNKKIGEAWAGAHPKRPSAVLNCRDLSFLDLIQSDPIGVLGERVFNQFGAQLPFLFKILTIGSPLSIQTHPDSAAAKTLHTLNPSRYPELTAKPEIGFAINTTEILFGFRPLEEIQQFCLRYPPLRDLFGRSQDLRELYRALLDADQPLVQKITAELSSLFTQQSAVTKQEQNIFTKFLKLQNLFPADIGVFHLFLLNLVELSPGSALFIPPNTLHAYLEGDIIECMATSDFVIRAGLTSKERDVESLFSTINLTPIMPEICIIKKVPNSDFFFFHSDSFEFELHYLIGSTDEVQFFSPALYFALEGAGAVDGRPFCSPDLLFVCGDNRRHRVEYSGKLFRVIIPGS